MAGNEDNENYQYITSSLVDQCLITMNMYAFTTFIKAKKQNNNHKHGMPFFQTIRYSAQTRCPDQ
jgi:hypothetical protein